MRLTVKNSTSHLDAPVEKLEEVLGHQIGHFCNHWPGAWHVVRDLSAQNFYLNLVDALPEAPGAAGYHDVDIRGRSYSRIAVNDSLENGSDWFTGPYSILSILGHEALETIADPLCTEWVNIDQSTLVAREVGDPVEATGRRYKGMDFTNFVLPSWFNAFGVGPFDDLGQLDAPFTMTDGGYMILMVNGEEKQKFADGVPEWRKSVARTRAIFRGLRG